MTVFRMTYNTLVNTDARKSTNSTRNKSRRYKLEKIVIILLMYNLPQNLPLN